MAKLFRAALLGVAVQQAQKFAKTPRGQQLIAQAKEAVNDPAKRAQLLQTVRAKAGQGQQGGVNRVATSQPGAADPYPPLTQPLEAPAPVSRPLPPA